MLEGQEVTVATRCARAGFFRGTCSSPLIAVDELDLTLTRDETLGLVGESGSGKTTFGQALIRLIHRTRGR